MANRDRTYVGHMLDACRRVQAKVRGTDRPAFDADENLRLALTHLLQVIGEAARRVSPTLRDAHPEVPWAAIVGMRHRVVHDYLDVDEDIVWQTATTEIGPLIAWLEPLVGPPDVP